LQYLFIPDTQAAQAASLQDTLSFSVIFGLFGFIVDRSIDLHHQTCGVAVEIDNVTVDNLLAAEMEAIQLVAPQGGPQLRFRRCHSAAQLFSPRELLWGDLLTSDDVAGFWHR
jgi:hypothetical protein